MVYHTPGPNDAIIVAVQWHAVVITCAHYKASTLNTRSVSGYSMVRTWNDLRFNQITDLQYEWADKYTVHMWHAWTRHNRIPRIKNQKWFIAMKTCWLFLWSHAPAAAPDVRRNWFSCSLVVIAVSCREFLAVSRRHGSPPHARLRGHSTLAREAPPAPARPTPVYAGNVSVKIMTSFLH